MVRQLRLILFSSISISGIFWIAGKFSYSIDVISFVAGLIAGAIVGAIELLLNDWVATVRRPYQPQVVRLETRETPAQVTGAATTARLVGAGVVTIALIVLMIVISFSGFPISIPVGATLGVIIFLIVFFAPPILAR